MITGQVLLLGLIVGGIYCLYSLGLNLIFGVMRVINFAHGAFAVLAAYIAREMAIRLGIDPFISTVAILPFFWLMGAIFYPTFVKSVSIKGGEFGTLFLMFGVSYAIDGILLYVWSGYPQIIPVSYATYSINLGFLMLPLVRFVCSVIAIAVTLVFYFLLKGTFLGKSIRATILDREASQLVGINTERVCLVSFGLGLVLAAIAGILTGIVYSFNPGSGHAFTIKAIVCVVAGGMGDFVGATTVAFILGIVEALFTSVAPAALVPIPAFVILLFIMVIKPQGIRGG